MAVELPGRHDLELHRGFRGTVAFPCGSSTRAFFAGTWPSGGISADLVQVLLFRPGCPGPAFDKLEVRSPACSLFKT